MVNEGKSTQYDVSTEAKLGVHVNVRFCKVIGDSDIQGVLSWMEYDIRFKTRYL